MTARFDETLLQPNDADASAPALSAPERPERRKLKSTKLDRTLAELESAFDDWNSVQPPAPAPAATLPGLSSPMATESGQTELKKRTKELLHQLREQLAELSDD